MFQVRSLLFLIVQVIFTAVKILKSLREDDFGTDFYLYSVLKYEIKGKLRAYEYINAKI